MNTAITDPMSGDETFSARRTAILLMTIWYAVLLVLLPLKLSLTLSTNYEQGNFPLDQVEWILMLWPSWLTIGLIGWSLVVTAIYTPSVTRLSLKRSLHIWLPWALLAIAAIPGFIVSSERLEARILFAHIASLGAAVAAVMLHIRAWPKSRGILLAAAVVGLALIAVYGWYQQFYGLEMMRDQMMYMIEYQGGQLNAKMAHRINSQRIFSTFASPNNYAAHLVLLLPLAAGAPLILWWRRRDDLRLPIMALASGLLAIITGLALFWTRSRGGILGIGVAMNVGILAAAITVARANPQWRRRIGISLTLYLLLGFCLAGVLYWKLQHGRDSDSLTYRLEYWKAGMGMMADRPATGVGLGEYMNYYLRVKPDFMDHEEARLPHNFVVFFASMTGVGGFLAALYLLLQPLLIGLQIIRGRLQVIDPWIALCVLTGVLAWLLHALLDFNLMNPGTAVTVAILPALLIDEKSDDGDTVRPHTRIPLILCGIVLAVVCLRHAPGERAYQQLANAIHNPNIPQGRLMQLFKDATELAPENPNPWYILARAAQKNGEHTVAIEAINKAIAIAPHRAKYHVLLAESLHADGRDADAATAIQTAVSWYPTKDDYLQTYIDITGEMPTGVPPAVRGHDGYGPTGPATAPSPPSPPAPIDGAPHTPDHTSDSQAAAPSTPPAPATE